MYAIRLAYANANASYNHIIEQEWCRSFVEQSIVVSADHHTLHTELAAIAIATTSITSLIISRCCFMCHLREVGH